jgi:hypothetical protein
MRHIFLADIVMESLVKRELMEDHFKNLGIASAGSNPLFSPVE